MRRRLTTIGASLALGVPLAFAAPAMADVYKVNTGGDKPDPRPNNGKCQTSNGKRSKCSLRAAVQTSNANPGEDTIRIAVSDLRLSKKGSGEDAGRTGDLDVSSEVIIAGRDASLDARFVDRAFDVTEQGELTVRALEVLNGAPPATESGGAYRSAGALTIQRSNIQNNAVRGEGASGGGIFNDVGMLTVRATEIRGNTAVRAGGGIEANEGVTTVERESVLTRNVAGPTPGNGGGLHLTGAGEVNVIDTMVRENQATAEGGGLWNSESGTMNVRDAKLFQNVASGPDADNGGGGIYNDGGELSITDRTKIGSNSADGTSGSGGGVLNVNGSLTLNDAVVSINDAVRAGGGIETVAGDVTIIRSDLFRNSAGANPGNGGGLHVTDATDTTVIDSRVTGNSAANEGGGLWNSATGTMVVVRTKVNSNTASGADSDAGGGGLYNDGGSLTVRGQTMIAGNAADGAAGSGGGILNVAGDLDVQGGSTLSGNSAVRAGGGIETVDGTVDLLDSDLLGNEVGNNPGNGGGLHVTGATPVNVTGARVVGNTAATEGGGLWNGGGTMTVDSSVIKANVGSGDEATNGGGGLFQNAGGTLVVQNGTTIVANVADGTSGSGGGILNDQGLLQITESELVRNTSSRAGGGIEANIGDTDLDSVLLSGNETASNPGNGGAVHLTGAGTVDVDNSAVVNNSAANEGGGLWNSATGTTTVTDTTLNDNVAPVGPNGYNDGGTFTIDGTPVAPGPPGV